MDSETSAAERWKEYFEENKLQFGLALSGLFLLVVGMGVFLAGRRSPESSVEILSTDESTSHPDTIIVDVAGAVENPGVYDLSLGARVDDALTAAGGFSEEADRVWVRRFVNLAQKVPDGAKVYIPAKGEADSNEQIAKSQVPITNDIVAGAATIGLGAETVGKINVNSASAQELDVLWGIGEKRAQAIIANRPYSSIEELRTKAGIPSNVYERIQAEITTY